MESEFEKLSLSDFKPSFEEYTIKTKIEEDLEGINLPQPSDLNQLILLDSRKLISFKSNILFRLLLWFDAL